MKRFYKIAVATAISVFCFIGKPVEVKAQVVTTDPLSLVQQILQIFQDADMSGWLEGTSSLTSSIEQYDNLREKIDDFKMVVDLIQDSRKLVSETISTTELILDTFEIMDSYKNYFTNLDSSYSYVYLENINNIKDGFFQVSNSMEDDFKSLLAELKNFKRGESSSIMQVAGELAEKFYAQVSQLSSIARARCMNTYEVACRMQDANDSRAIRKMFIY